MNFDEGNNPSLHTAVRLGRVEHVRKILDKKCLDTATLCGLLHNAVLYGQVEVARLLITNYSCSVDCRNNSKQTSLHIACSKGHLSVVRVLVSEHKANLNARDKDNNTPLNKAVLGGQIDVVKCLINEFSCSPSNKGFQDRTIIHQACNAGHVELVETLLTDYNLDPFSIDDNEDTPLHIAALCGKINVVKVLITKYNSPVDCRNIINKTPLHYACYKGHLRVVRMLVSEHKANLNARDMHNNTPLHEAAFGGQTDAVKCLINEFSCNPNIKGFEGRTILHQACNAGNVELVETLLIHYNLDPLSVDDNGSTPLHNAALCGKIEVAEMLITKYNSPVDCRNNSNRTPLHHACSKGHLSVVRMLVSEHKADLNARDKHNNTPLHEAPFGRQIDTVKCLINEFSCSSNIKGFQGRTILHQACNVGHVELVEILLIHYIPNPLIVDDNGDTPLHIAALCGKKEVAKLLITKYNSPVDCINNNKQTPLHYACMKGHLSIVRMLVSEHKSDLGARDKHNDTPLNKAALVGQIDVIKCLINEFSCSPKVKGFQGRTILHQACDKDHESLAKVLIDSYHLSLLSTDNDGNTPLHISAMFGRERCVHMLLYDYHAPVYLRNKSGDSVYGVIKNTAIKKIMSDYLKQEHDRIQYDYKEVQTLSSKKYSGAQRLTRVFVVGNVGSGKSTLIESLKREGFFSSLNEVSEATVPPHTSGIVPSEHYSKTTGRVLYYDFAGDPEYYSSHSAIMSNVMQSEHGTNVCMVLTNLTKDIKFIHKELGYWFSFISYHIINRSIKCKVVVIGSHVDLIADAGTKMKLDTLSQFVHEYLSDTPKATLKFEVIDILTLNCRQPWSSRSVRNTLVQTIKKATRYYLSGEAAILLGLLEKDFKNVITCKLQTLLTHIEETGIHLPNTASSLYPIVRKLHTVGLLMTIRKHEDSRLEDTLLLLDVSKLTSEVHKRLFSGSTAKDPLSSSSTNLHSASMGILPHTYLKSILPKHITTDCLVQLQYCQEFSHAEVKSDHSVVPTEDSSAPSLLYFPAMCTTERKGSIVTPDDYIYSIGWFAECQNKFGYFPSRFLHVLLLRLAFKFAHPVAPSETEGETEPDVDIIKSNCGCTMWKNGIHWHMEEGVECIVELVSNSKGLVVITKSTIEEERKCKCTEMLFKIINMALQAKEEFCHTISLKQYLMPLGANNISSFIDRDKLFDLNDVDRVLREGKAVVLSITRRWPIETSRLTHMKRYTFWSKSLLLELSHFDIIIYIHLYNT